MEKIDAPPSWSSKSFILGVGNLYFTVILSIALLSVHHPPNFHLSWVLAGQGLHMGLGLVEYVPFSTTLQLSVVKQHILVDSFCNVADLNLCMTKRAKQTTQDMNTWKTNRQTLIKQKTIKSIKERS